MPAPLRPVYPERMPIDSVRLEFDAASLLTLNVILGVLMFGVALDLRLRDFQPLARAPSAPLIGLAAQLVLLPALTFLLTRVLPVAPSVKLGMILVASCPGGNLSNFMTHLAGGRVAPRWG